MLKLFFLFKINLLFFVCVWVFWWYLHPGPTCVPSAQGGQERVMVHLELELTDGLADMTRNQTLKRGEAFLLSILFFDFLVQTMCLLFFFTFCLSCVSLWFSLSHSLSLCLCVWLCLVYVHVHVEVRGQPVGVSSVLSLYTFWELNANWQAQQQEASLAPEAHQLPFVCMKFVGVLL